ncbi:nitroreductase [Mycobacteroides abscessus subsp. abscessus]|nr:nitroreductase [Mycobacteroides abscessus subsp. abscessus]
MVVGHSGPFALDEHMPNINEVKRRVVHTVQRRLVNPVGRQLPVTMLETIGRKSGEPRHTAIGGRVIDGAFWLVSEHGDHADFVRNIKRIPLCACVSTVNGAAAPHIWSPTTTRSRGCGSSPS